MAEAVGVVGIRPFPASPRQADRRAPPPVSRGAMAYGVAICVGFFGLFGGAAALVPLDSAAVAPGVINSEGNRRAIQHLEGGLVQRIHVREGSRVAAGEPLVTLDGAKAELARSILHGRLAAARALAARLRAERDGHDDIAFEFNDTELDDPEVLDAVAGQLRIFAARRDALRSQRDVLAQRTGQLRAEIAGLREQIAAQDRQSALIDQEIAAVSGLVGKGLERQSRLLALQRAKAEIDIAQALARAAIARGEQRIGETLLQGEDLQVRLLNEVVAELREVDDTVFGLRQQLRDAETTLARTVIRAGVDGSVVGLAVFTVGGVIAPGQVIMSLVPDHEPLVVEARVHPNDIDVVTAGLPARVRLAAFSQRVVDIVTGTVASVSADRLTDPVTNVPYYLARIDLDPAGLPPAIAGRLLPGMGVEVMIRTGEQTLLGYVTKPLRDSLARALIEG